VQATHRALRQTSEALASGAAFLDRRRQAVVVTSSPGSHPRYYWLLLAEGHLTRQRFGSMLRRVAALPPPNG